MTPHEPNVNLFICQYHLVKSLDIWSNRAHNIDIL